MNGTVKREELLAELNSVRGGLTSKEIIEQSSSFAFKNGRVMTYNDEVACTNACQLNIVGAVPHKSLLNILEKRTDDVLSYEVDKGTLKLRGKQGTSKITMEAEVALPIDNVEYPDKSQWRKLPEDFEDAVGMVQDCASKDESRFNLTCIHLHPEWMEACDNFQIMRYHIELGLEHAILIRRDALKQIMTHGITKFAETETWAHFKNPKGLILSVKRHVRNDYPDLTELLNIKGAKTVLPKGLAEATERCDVFSSENVDDNHVRVSLKPNKLSILGKGVTGSHFEPYRAKVNYKGPPLTFRIKPQLLSKIVKEYSRCEVTPERLKVNGGKYTFIAWLYKEGSKEEVSE